jgi:RNA polymerase sigma factor (sigma-70 family)
LNAVKEDAARLVRLAASGDTSAWERLIDQHARLISAITWEFRLADMDAADVAQTTWMRLIEHIHRIEHPEHIASWLATTARNECRHHLAARKRVVLSSGEDSPFEDLAANPAEVDDALLAAERTQVVRQAMSKLPRRWQRLMEMLMADPPVPYADISMELGLPIGSIGPTRGRCIARLRVLLQACY